MLLCKRTVHHHVHLHGTACHTPRLCLTNYERKTVCDEPDRSKKSWDKSHDKNVQEIRKKENFLNLIMSIYKTPTANITIKNEKVNTLPQQWTIRRALSPVNISNGNLQVPATAVGPEILTPLQTNSSEREVLFTDNTTVHVCRKPEGIYKKTY